MAKTPKPKRAAITVASLNVTCPYCSSGLPAPSDGSLIWTVWEVANTPTRTCIDCGRTATLTLPKRALVE